MKKDTCNVFYDKIYRYQFIIIYIFFFYFLMNAYGLYKHMVFKMPFQLFANFLVKNRNGSDSKKKKNPPRQKLFSFLDASRIQEECQRQRTVYYTQETSEYQHSCNAFSDSNSHRAKISRPDDTCLGSRLH